MRIREKNINARTTTIRKGHVLNVQSAFYEASQKNKCFLVVGKLNNKWGVVYWILEFSFNTNFRFLQEKYLKTTSDVF